jgi:GT2 family glycosyltransferase
MTSIAALITCFNRREKTLECIARLKKQQEIDSILLAIYIVDDGSSDGTTDAISIAFPEVHIIQGNGSLYWNGGMRLAWRRAAEVGYDFYLWVNDDSMITSCAISKIVKTYNDLLGNRKTPGAVIGTMVSPRNHRPTYGGRLSHSRINPLNYGSIMEPIDKPLMCDFINGNFTLIPALAVTKIGILSDIFTHSMGDFDYGLRLKEAGLSCWVASGVYGECEVNSESGGCKDNRLKIAKRVEKMRDIRQMPPVKEWLYFVRRHGGPIWPLLWFKGWLRGKVPFLWTLLRGKDF